jgi:hypothetical protein
VQPDGPTVERAVQFYDQDFPAIFQAGGRIISDEDANGNAITSWRDLDEHMQTEAAKRGGTHVIRTRKDVESIFLQVSQARSDTDCAATPGSAHCSTVYSAPAFAKLADLPSAHYVIVFVPCENWGKLPGALRPAPGGVCDQADASLVVTRVSSNSAISSGHSNEATPEPSAAASDSEVVDSAPARADDFIDQNCEVNRRPNETAEFSRLTATLAFEAAERESLKCDWGDRDVTVVLTLGPSGCLRQTHVEDAEHDVTFNACIVRAFSQVSVPAFRGRAVIIAKHLGSGPH